MYARHVSFQLKPTRREELTQMFDREILPLLQKQNGFTDEITLVDSDGQQCSPSACGTARKARTITTARPIPRCSRA